MKVMGTVIKFDVSRGFGFVLPDGERQAAFIHVKNVEGELLLRKDDRLEFELITTKRGPLALNAVLLSDGECECVLIGPKRLRPLSGPGSGKPHPNHPRDIAPETGCNRE